LPVVYSAERLVTAAPPQQPLPQSLDAWLDYISHQHSAEIVMGLERVRTVWQRMGSPQAPRNVVVGGTNGKGSTCAMLEAVLHIAGYKTGFYSSPHLRRFNERVRIAHAEASDTLLVQGFSAVERARREGEPVPLTYFEYATLAAFWCFAHEQIEVGVLEVGMGGRLDAVNLIDGDVSIITAVDLDHQQFLGDTIEKIGWEKAHIYRPNRLAIFADCNLPATVAAYAAGIGATLCLVERDYQIKRMDGQWQWQGTILGQNVARHSLPYPALRGSYQLRNAAAALAALAALGADFPVSQNQVKRGLLEVDWPGRMQVLPGRPTVVLDVAHNPHAARALNDALGTMGFYQNTFAVFSMFKDKDIATVIGILKHRIDHWYIAALEGERAADLPTLAALFDGEGLAGRYTQCLTIEGALREARSRANENDRILGFGSFYTVASLFAAIDPAA
jgi:dihydrofolate synthase / folylpolyglutamate synthase